MALQFNEIDTATTKVIMPGLVDLFFKSGPLMAFMKRNRYKVWRGGPQIQHNYLYRPMIGGAYAKGAQFNITKRQVLSGIVFSPKFYEVNATEYGEDVEVLASGSTRAFSIVKAHLGDAAMTMSAILAIASYHHGQNLVGDDRSLELNGLEEALTDGVAATYSGATFPAYGGQTRVDVQPALNSPSTVGGTPNTLIPANVAGAMQYRTLEHSYQSNVIGEQHPVIGVTTPRGMGFLNENFQPQQRIDQKEPTIGYTGMKFKDATLLQDNYCPGGEGVNDPDIGNYLTADGFETFWWLNPGGEGDDSFINLWFVESTKYQFGWTGFKVAQDSTVIAGQILYGGNMTVTSPRLMRAMFGIQR